MFINIYNKKYDDFNSFIDTKRKNGKIYISHHKKNNIQDNLNINYTINNMDCPEGPFYPDL